MADFDLIKKHRTHALRRQATDTALAATKANSPIPHGIVQRALANPHTRQSADLLYLQRTIGNGAVSQMLQRSGSSLRVGASDDRFEQEANRVSEQVPPAGQTRSVQRVCWISRAFSTRWRMLIEDSPPSKLASFCMGTRGTSRWMSMRSSNGPEIRF